VKISIGHETSFGQGAVHSIPVLVGMEVPFADRNRLLLKFLIGGELESLF